MEFDVQYDVVVCGGGASGKSAAYTVASESDLTVCLLEKLDATGGGAQYAEGMCASESSEQKKRDKPDYPGPGMPEDAHYPTHEEHFKRYIDYTHHRANPDVVRAFVWNSAETIDIMKSIGVEFDMVSIYAVDQDNELYTFHRPVGLGARVQELLHRACENAGVDIFVSTPAKELIFDESGRVAGVKAVDGDGNELLVGAKAVILATGGFGQSPEHIKKYSWMPQLSETDNRILPLESTGEGIDMALSAGGDTDAIGVVQIAPSVLGKMLGTALHGLGFQPNLWLDSKCRRFVDECISKTFALSGNIIGQRDDGIVWSLLDSETFKHYAEVGSDIGLGDFIPYKEPIANLEAEVNATLEAEEGAVFKADTLEDLAAQMGVDKDAFLAAVESYNAKCDAGYDDEFFKDAEYLRPLRTAPFYAVHMAPCILCTDGGIRVNGDMQVTNSKYEPIAGLYAVGNEASGLFGDVYNLDCPGTTNGFAHTSGRLAGRAAIKEILGA